MITFHATVHCSGCRNEVPNVLVSAQGATHNFNFDEEGQCASFDYTKISIVGEADGWAFGHIVTHMSDDTTYALCPTCWDAKKAEYAAQQARVRKEKR